MFFLILFLTLDCCLAAEEDHYDFVDIPIMKSVWNSLFGYKYSGIVTPFQYYRNLLGCQRWKKSKKEMFRQAYGFGKKKRSSGQYHPFEEIKKRTFSPSLWIWIWKEKEKLLPLE